MNEKKNKKFKKEKKLQEKSSIKKKIDPRMKCCLSKECRQSIYNKNKKRAGDHPSVLISHNRELGKIIPKEKGFTCFPKVSIKEENAANEKQYEIYKKCVSNNVDKYICSNIMGHKSHFKLKKQEGARCCDPFSEVRRAEDCWIDQKLLDFNGKDARELTGYDEKYT